jgi:hypothetical protein
MDGKIGWYEWSLEKVDEEIDESEYFWEIVDSEIEWFLCFFKEVYIPPTWSQSVANVPNVGAWRHVYKRANANANKDMAWRAIPAVSVSNVDIKINQSYRTKLLVRSPVNLVEGGGGSQTGQHDVADPSYYKRHWPRDSVDPSSALCSAWNKNRISPIDRIIGAYTFITALIWGKQWVGSRSQSFCVISKTSGNRLIADRQASEYHHVDQSSKLNLEHFPTGSGT